MSFSPTGLSSCVTKSTDGSDDVVNLALLNSQRRLRNMSRVVPEVCHALSECPPRDGFRYRCIMVTLTYRKRGAAAYSPDDIRDFGKRIDSWAKSRKILVPRVWVLELQRDGTPHYHVTMYIPYGHKLPKPDKQGWWPHGMSNLLMDVRHAGRYMAKYLSKISSKAGFSGCTFPKGARIFGVKSLPQHALRAKRHYSLPLWLRELVSPLHLCKRRFEGFWYCEDSDMSFLSPWCSVTDDDGRIAFHRVKSAYDFYLHGDVEHQITKKIGRNGWVHHVMSPLLSNAIVAKKRHIALRHFEE